MIDKADTPALLSTHIEQVPIGDVLVHPRNPNRGDIEVIVESIRENGFFDPILVQKSTMFALSGNHTLQAAQSLGMETIPAIIVDVDDDRATRILLASNQTARRAAYDDQLLADLLNEMADLADGLVGTGFDFDDLDLLLATTAVSIERELGDQADDTAASIRQTPGEREAEWANSGIRSLILPYATEQFETVVERLGVLRSALNIENNAALIAHLIEQAATALDSE